MIMYAKRFLPTEALKLLYRLSSHSCLFISMGFPCFYSLQEHIERYLVMPFQLMTYNALFHTGFWSWKKNPRHESCFKKL